MDLIASEYGWTDEQILDRTLARLTQCVAAIQRRQWLDDLAHRRLETAKLRTLCAYIASTLQLAEGADNVMLTEAANLSLGTGTEAPPRTPAATAAAAPRAAGGPAARVPVGNLADAPAAIRAGQHTDPGNLAGARLVRLDEVGRLFGGAL